MVFDRIFLLGLSWRVIALVLALAGLVYVAVEPGLHAATLVAWGACVGLIASLWGYVQRTNHELARFVEALTYGDFSATFGHKREGFGFEQLGQAMNLAVAKLREERARSQDTNRTLAAMLDEVPTPLLTLDGEGNVDLANKAARRMFSQHKATRIEDMAAYGARFADDLAHAPVGERRTTQMMLDETPQTAALSVAEVRQPGGAPLRLFAVQPIQGELDQVEMNAWRDLVRVLTHEIMNSVTPITSLAKSAAEIVAEVDDGRDPALADARAAIETVARRADGVMHFVQTYRQISRSPPLRKQSVPATALFEELTRLFRADWPAVELAVEIEPANLDLYADPDLVAQVVINLMRNAAEAAAAHADRPWVSLRGHRNRHGRTVIEVEDNGPGVPDDKTAEIFLPFFTTKPQGTGVGLSLARQIVLAHGGSLTYQRGGDGGALFRIVI
jgi:two-component system, NtrC family, nitrogen regulation sensor histidine kinase NtrY